MGLLDFSNGVMMWELCLIKEKLDKVLNISAEKGQKKLFILLFSLNRAGFCKTVDGSKRL